MGIDDKKVLVVVFGVVVTNVTCSAVLILIAIVLIHPASRSLADRVSFRITTYAMVASMGQCAAGVALFKVPKSQCAFPMWLSMFTWTLSAFLFFCIALNLQLVLVHGVNGQQMEKYYVGVSLLLAITLSVPPFAADQYGWDPLFDICWYRSSDISERLKWQIFSEYSRSILCVVCELVSFSVVIWYLFRRRIFLRARRQSQSNSHDTVSVRHDLLTKVVLRTALYPVVSLVVNIMTMSVSILANSSGSDAKTDYLMLLVGPIIWIIRIAVYSLLAVTDPSLLRGLRAIRESRRQTQSGIYGSSTFSPVPLSSIGQLTEITTEQMNEVTDRTFDKMDSTNISIDARDIDAELGVDPYPLVRVVLSRHMVLEERHMVEIGKHL
ncbi:hypothetical protein Moror_8552 [Moniliophthora roreri MCA 2997]|uniref:G-protein coupled receptors family 2 profile 2 domain-containing protein n=2 Tax=Moniliophthora roreri TaxID=221103 RepID=V2W6M7_MONRO|nr:hypothetical protein Moror_8552 [Moniliophthora roreri MCA 2997]